MMACPKCGGEMVSTWVDWYPNVGDEVKRALKEPLVHAKEGGRVLGILVPRVCENCGYAEMYVWRGGPGGP